MDILLIGGGGREHALAWKLGRSPIVDRLFACPGSDAIGRLATCIPLDSHAAIAEFVGREGIGLTVIGPEAPLVDGLVDVLTAQGHKAFGPTSGAAALEGSKTFSKDFMARHGIATASYASFDTPQAALAYVEGMTPPVVIKADGLAAGKGVSICHTLEEARTAIGDAMVRRAFGDAGARLIVEGFLEGEEASFFAICDGEDFISFPVAQDHKPVGELDRGPNTGGMGAYCPVPLVTPEMEQRVVDEVVRPTLRGMAAEGNPYRGVLYVGLMISGSDIKVLEYNCRFGDPECQPLMMMLESDLAEILLASAEGRISRIQPKWRRGASVCIVLASGGYPANPATGFPIGGLEAVTESDSLRIFHAGTAYPDKAWINRGGRVLGVTAWGQDLAQALERGYGAVEKIGWEGMHYRRDIGLKGMRHDRRGRPEINVGIVPGEAGVGDSARETTALLSTLGIGSRLFKGAAGKGDQPLRSFLHTCEDEGAELFLALPGSQAGLARLIQEETSRPVIDAGTTQPANPAGVGAALDAAQVLAKKYPDVHAALQEYRIRQSLPEPGASTC